MPPAPPGSLSSVAMDAGPASLWSVLHAEKVTKMSHTQELHSLFYFSKDDIHVKGKLCNLEITWDRI